jgi:hypothetical protein
VSEGRTLAVRETAKPVPSSRAVLQRKCACGNHTAGGKECPECARKRGLLQRKAAAPSAHSDAPEIVHDVLRSPGRPLDRATRAYMEPRFGRDLGAVRLHTDGLAAASARAVDALAYTVGHDVVMGANQYEPGTPAGRRLLAHELAHTLQQPAAAPTGRLAIGEPGSASERQADAAAASVVDGRSAPSLAHAGAPALQRTPVDGRSTGLGRSTLPYREARDLASCTTIMGSEHAEFCEREVLGAHVPDAPLPVRAGRVSQDLRNLIAGATWKEIRKRVYPRESAAGVQRARDRRAGRLPELTGLGRTSSLDHFATAVRAVQANWGSLSADARKNRLGGAASAELVAADVPGFLAVEKQPMESKGFFRGDNWSFTISEELVTNAALTDDDAGELANTALHEGRHAEQAFLAARFSADVNGRDAAGLHAEQDIPVSIAQQAVNRKFNARTDPRVRALGSSMFTATVTDRAANQQISDDVSFTALAARKAEAESALRNLSARVTPQTYDDAVVKRNALRMEILDLERRYTRYRNIPYEADAHEVGDAAALAFGGWR